MHSVIQSGGKEKGLSFGFWFLDGPPSKRENFSRCEKIFKSSDLLYNEFFLASFDVSAFDKISFSAKVAEQCINGNRPVIYASGDGVVAAINVINGAREVLVSKEYDQSLIRNVRFVVCPPEIPEYFLMMLPKGVPTHLFLEQNKCEAFDKYLRKYVTIDSRQLYVYSHPGPRSLFWLRAKDGSIELNKDLLYILSVAMNKIHAAEIPYLVDVPGQHSLAIKYEATMTKAAVVLPNIDNAVPSKVKLSSESVLVASTDKKQVCEKLGLANAI